MLKKLFLGERFADALRNTVAVILPLLLFYSHRQWAIGMAVGALLISLTDLPGSRNHKLRDALRNTLLFFVVTLIFIASPWTGITLVGLTFLLAMFAAFGGRSGASGTMAIALTVFLLGLRPEEPFYFSLAILLGCIWFQLISLLQVWIWPYRSLRQAIIDAQTATSEFLRAKADCYDLNVPLELAYQKTIALHIKVWEKQELVRQLLPEAGRAPALLAEAVKVIALYEQLTAMHYDYAEVRERLAPTGLLPIISKLINALADHRPTGIYINELQSLAKGLDREDAAVIRSVLINAEAIQNLPNQAAPDLDAFRPTAPAFHTHFTLHSPVLRFALRLTLLFAIAYTGITYLAKDNYGYWLLLTIIIVARPRLAITWQRNFERLSGTFIGVTIAGLLLWLLPDAIPLLVFAGLTLLGFFYWNRPKYAWSVTCITTSVVICLNLYHGGPELLITARLIYSLIGCVLAIAGLLIFPVWVSAEVEELAEAAVAANRELLQAVTEQQSETKIRLARKTAHLRLAKLSEGLAHARVESRHPDLGRLEQIQVLNYRINGVILSLYLSGKPVNGSAPKAGLRKGRGLLEHLFSELEKLNDGKLAFRNNNFRLQGKI